MDLKNRKIQLQNLKQNHSLRNCVFTSNFSKVWWFVDWRPNLIWILNLMCKTSISEWNFKNQITVQLACFTEAIQLLNKMHSVWMCVKLEAEWLLCLLPILTLPWAQKSFRLVRDFCGCTTMHNEMGWIKLWMSNILFLQISESQWVFPISILIVLIY